MAAPAPKDKVDEALEEPLPYETRDTLSQSEVASVVLSHKAEVDSCISQFAPSNPEAPPRLVMRWKVDPEGRASEVVALNEDFRGGPLAGCMAKQIARWSFPKHPAARDSVIFPFPLPR